MTWLLALAYVLALLLVCAGALARDERIGALLGSDGVGAERATGRRLGRVLSRAVARRVRARRSAGAAGAVPDLLDVLAVSVTAGLSPRLALERLPEDFSEPLADTLTGVKRNVALGMPWHLALERAGVNGRLPELCRLAVTLRRAERLGSPISERLRDLASDVRSERRADREERARRAPVKMLFPLVFLILPAFVLAAVVPALLVATRDLI